MKIQVERKHIEQGIARDSRHCMIADAIKQRIPSAQYIMVDVQSIRFSDKEEGIRYVFFTPARAQANLLKFDQGDPSLKPFTFELREAAKMRAVGWRGQRAAGASRKSKPRKKATKKAPAVAYKERQFGLRKMSL